MTGEVRPGATGEPERARVVIHVHPRSRRPRVGGDRHGALVVAVAEPAVDGAATAAAIKALARALSLPARDLTLVTGATSRTKLVEIPATARPEFDALRGS